MSQKTYMYDTQWQALINAISGGDPTAIVTALGDIKNSIDTIETALGSLSADVTQDSTQWTNLINAISSGGGGGGGTIDIDATQWGNLLTEIGKGDMTATATALNNIYTRLNSIGFNSTQWTNLVNAITNQSLTVDLSNITSSAVTNLSNVPGATSTDALNALNSTLSNMIVSQYINNGATLALNTPYQIDSNILNSKIIIVISSRFNVYDSLTIYKTPYVNSVVFTLLGEADKKYKFTMSVSNGTITCTSIESGLSVPYVTIVGIK